MRWIDSNCYCFGAGDCKLILDVVDSVGAKNRKDEGGRTAMMTRRWTT